ncbi:MAG TPA: lamin tail domain-containing protein [Planctomycetota bacterium]|nr:lamin tail domain-containing protein [Planctomycetota bacterium]
MGLETVRFEELMRKMYLLRAKVKIVLGRPFRPATLLFFLLLFQPAGVPAQDYSVLRINEVLSANETQLPLDSQGEGRDLVEIYNSGDAVLVLGTSNSRESLALSDTADLPAELALWKFRAGVSTIQPKGFLVIFLANRPGNALFCELFTGFALARDGTEPITLWGPVTGTDTEGKPIRSIIDQIWVPPLDEDVSFGRFPDGAGDASPVPINGSYSSFKFYPRDTSTFGTCSRSCPVVGPICPGASNGPGGNLTPRVNTFSHSTNHPAQDEPVELLVRVDDDKEPTPPNIAQVVLRYSVNGGAESEVAMVHDDELGIQTGAANGRPLERWTIWRGTIPGQAKGARVDFTFFVRDAEGLSSTHPRVPCGAGVGPCDNIGLPGPDCVREPSPSLQYVPCSLPNRYTVGYDLEPGLERVVINEVMASQTKVIVDPTEPGSFDDYIEILNGSDAPVDLTGYWLSDKAFHPQGWQFPAGSIIGAGERIIVWTDSDGGQCPRPPKIPNDGQNCPDPTDPSKGYYHANFALDRERDQIYLFDRADRAFGVIHGVEFEAQEPDVSWSLFPDGDRGGTFGPAPGTPGEANSGPAAPSFRRGDSNSDCKADITDAVFTLSHLFQGGPAPGCPDAADSDDDGATPIADVIVLLSVLFQGGPGLPPPGSIDAGPDPTEDELGPCEEVVCE